MSCEVVGISSRLIEYLELSKDQKLVNRIIGGLALSNQVASIHVFEATESSAQLHVIAECKGDISRAQKGIFLEVDNHIHDLNQAIGYLPEVILHKVFPQMSGMNLRELVEDVPPDSTLLFSATILRDI